MVYKRNCEIRTGIEFPSGMQRVALGVEYNGALFKGFQKQKSTPDTVQAALEKALTSVASEDISLVCAGRTDAGVHATNQIVHFDTLAQRPDKAWIHGVNTQLPDGVRVVWCRNVEPSFHARFGALSRTYRYLIFRSDMRPAILYQQLTWVKWQLDANAMNSAAQVLVGEHDFTSFRASQCQAASPVRHIHKLDVKASDDLLVIEVTASAFLHHMVRNIVGALLEVGRGAGDLQWLENILAARNRTLAPATASAAGLYLVKIDYPEKYHLPARAKGPLFIDSHTGFE